jgi:hypothetical protein
MMKPAEDWYCCDAADLLRTPKIRRVLANGKGGKRRGSSCLFQDSWLALVKVLGIVSIAIAASRESRFGSASSTALAVDDQLV